MFTDRNVHTVCGVMVVALDRDREHLTLLRGRFGAAGGMVTALSTRNSKN